jgi:hypothetical protein|tara:strand:+ start:451 stop:669 length:219 start_codon:yes stop_codon:yes gene_type:complete
MEPAQVVADRVVTHLGRNLSLKLRMKQQGHAEPPQRGHGSFQITPLNRWEVIDSGVAQKCLEASDPIFDHAG